MEMLQQMRSKKQVLALFSVRSLMFISAMECDMSPADIPWKKKVQNKKLL